MHKPAQRSRILVKEGDHKLILIYDTMMFRLTAVLATLLSVAAFAPVARVARSSSLKMGFESEIGAQPPLGFWDPLGLLDDADQDRFDRLRYVETKHGRISMLAILGHLVTTAGWRLGGDIAPGLKFADMKTGLAAFETIPAGGIVQIVLFIGALELGFGLRQVSVDSRMPPSLFASMSTRLDFELT